MAVLQKPAMARGPKGKRAFTPFGTRLREAIEASSYSSRAAFLRDVGIEPATVYRYEVGDRDPPLSLVQSFADALGVTVASLLGETHADDGWADTRAWRDFVVKGYLDFFRQRGVTEAQLEHARRTPFRGTPRVRDYVQIVEDMLREVRPEEPEAMREARRRNLREGSPDVADLLPKPPTK